MLPKDLGGYTVGVLVNVNTGSREELLVGGVPVGRAFEHDLLPVFPKGVSVRTTGRAADGSIIIVVATDAPLDHNALHDIAKRATMGLARTGATSHTSSGDLFIAFSTTHIYPRDGGITGPPLENDEDRIDALFSATVDATEEAIDDAIFSARTMTGANGITLFGLPYDRVKTAATLARSRWTCTFGGLPMPRWFASARSPTGPCTKSRRRGTLRKMRTGR